MRTVVLGLACVAGAAAFAPASVPLRGVSDMPARAAVSVFENVGQSVIRESDE